MSNPIGNEFVEVIGITAYGSLCGQSEFFTTQQIANLAGGTGGAARSVTSGTTDSVMSNDTFIAWKSASTSPKSEALGPGAYTGQTFYIKDAIGTSGTYNITVTASGCTIDLGGSIVMNQNFMALGFKWDGTSNWMVF